MSRTTPIDWRTANDALIRWVENATGITAVWGNQAAPQPKYPYASLLKGPSPTSIPTVDRESWNDDGELEIVGQREFGLSVQIHIGPPENVDPDCDAGALAGELFSSIALPTTKAAFDAAGLSLRDRTTPQQIDILVGADWISRQLIELRFGIVSVLNPLTAPALDAVGYFDKIRMTSTVEPLANPGGDLDLDDELFDPNA